MSRLAAILPAAALVILIALFAGYSLHRNPTVTPMAMVGRPAPRLTLPRLADGAPAPLGGPAGGPILVNFFASWCAPCVQEAPALMALKTEGVTIVGVAYKDAPADTRRFLARFGDPYQVVLVDAAGRAGVEFGATGAPETYVIDRAGIIRGKWALPITAAAAESLLQRAGR